MFTECGRQLTESTGTLTSPGYPGSYPPNADCIWVITAPRGHYIELKFKIFDIHKVGRGCRYDYVEVRDGNSRNSPSLGRHCGQSGNFFLLLDTSDQIKLISWVVFHLNLTARSKSPFLLRPVFWRHKISSFSGKSQFQFCLFKYVWFLKCFVVSDGTIHTTRLTLTDSKNDDEILRKRALHWSFGFS